MHFIGYMLVSHVSACWLTGLRLGTPSRYLARTISWNACKLLLLLLLLLSLLLLLLATTVFRLQQRQAT